MEIPVTTPRGATDTGVFALPVFLLRATSRSSTARGSGPVADQPFEVRAAFIQRTYLHLVGAIVGFTVIECLLFGTGLALLFARALPANAWPLALVGLVLVSVVASRVARASVAPAIHYATLLGYVLSEAILFVPLLVEAQLAAAGLLQSAAMVTLMGITGLAVVVWTTRRDFSFLGNLLGFAGVVAVVLIVAGLMFGFEPGTFFSVWMVTLAGAAILHETSSALRHYPADRHVGAALELSTSVTLMFWHVLRRLLSWSGRHRDVGPAAPRAHDSSLERDQPQHDAQI